MDKVTSDRIQKLHPLVRDEVKQIIKECDKALTGRAKIRITQGLRSFEEQERLYAIGRLTSGKK
jgi:peptidoglycan L-alanyl-D-glutamate endopeptidase CwlK